MEHASFNLFLAFCPRILDLYLGKGRKAVVDTEREEVEVVLNFWLLARIPNGRSSRIGVLSRLGVY
jgi:hypothetical protein